MWHCFWYWPIIHKHYHRIIRKGLRRIHHFAKHHPIWTCTFIGAGVLPSGGFGGWRLGGGSFPSVWFPSNYGWNSGGVSNLIKTPEPSSLMILILPLIVVLICRLKFK